MMDVSCDCPGDEVAVPGRDTRSRKLMMNI